MSDVKSIKTVLYGLRKTKDRVAYLRQNNSPQLRKVLKANFDSRIQFMVPPGVPDIEMEFKETLTLEAVADKLYLIIKGATDKNKLQCEKQFVDWLQGLSKTEGKILTMIKDKNLQKTFPVTLELVKEAFPETHIVD